MRRRLQRHSRRSRVSLLIIHCADDQQTRFGRRCIQLVYFVRMFVVTSFDRGQKEQSVCDLVVNYEKTMHADHDIMNNNNV